MKESHNKANARAELNPNRWDSTERWMKFDIVIQQVQVLPE